jgi:hypothetical protein
MKQKILIATVAIGAVAILSGCGTKNELQNKTQERARETKTAMPESFPKDIFVYEDAYISESQISIENKNASSLVYYTKSSQTEAVEKYKKEMAKNGWTLDSDFNVGGQTGQVMNFKKSDLTAGIIIGSSQSEDKTPGETAVSINVGSGAK